MCRFNSDLGHRERTHGDGPTPCASCLARSPEPLLRLRCRQSEPRDVAEEPGEHGAQRCRYDAEGFGGAEHGDLHRIDDEVIGDWGRRRRRWWWWRHDHDRLRRRCGRWWRRGRRGRRRIGRRSEPQDVRELERSRIIHRGDRRDQSARFQCAGASARALPARDGSRGDVGESRERHAVDLPGRPERTERRGEGPRGRIRHGKREYSLPTHSRGVRRQKRVVRISSGDCGDRNLASEAEPQTSRRKK